LHRDLSKFTRVGYSGNSKNCDNIIAEKNVDEKITGVIFEPLKPYETPTAVNSICGEYKTAIERHSVNPLIIIPIFIHDFLCVHPSNDGNERTAE
jgi:Fic family protein